MPETSSREGFTLRLYLSGVETSMYSYDLGWINAPARSQGFQVSSEALSSAVGRILGWWQHVLSREPQPVKPVTETPLESKITLLNSGPDAGKLEYKIAIGELEVTWLWDPATDQAVSSPRAAFQLSPAGFDWYMNSYKSYLDAIYRIRENSN
jgi:hypothetical protein